jgi:hypothetical protein
MKQKTLTHTFFAIITLCFFLTGCFTKNTNPVFFEDETIKPAKHLSGSIAFKIIMPEESKEPLGSIRAESIATPTVTFKLILINSGNATMPTTTLLKTVPVDIGTGIAQATFTNVPACTCIGDIHIEGGSINSYSDFHGAIDLVAGFQNILEVAPKGSKLQQDFVAHVIKQIVASPVLFGKALPNLFAQVVEAISELDKTKTTAYDDAVALFAKYANITIVVSSAPKITAISPLAGDPSTLISIYGENFGSVQGENYISYDGKALSLDSIYNWTDTMIQVYLPADSLTNQRFKVSVSGLVSNESTTYAFNNIKVSSIYPSSGNLGSVVNINGLGFGTSQVSGAYVTFYDLSQTTNYSIAPVINWSDTLITCNVPTNLTISQSGIIGFTVWKSSSTYVSSTFNLILPTISYIDPNTAHVAATISLNGSGFGTTQGTGYVSIGGNYASIVSWSDNQIRVKVPDFSSAGEKNVILTVSNKTYSNNNFSVAAPQYQSLTYPSGDTEVAYGETFIIYGRYFGSATDFDDSNAIRNIQIQADGKLYTVNSATWSDNQVSFAWPVPNTTLDDKTAAVTINVGGLSTIISNIQAD